MDAHRLSGPCVRGANAINRTANTTHTRSIARRAVSGQFSVRAAPDNEDVNDADRLALDPVMRQVVGVGWSMRQAGLGIQMGGSNECRERWPWLRPGGAGRS